MDGFQKIVLISAAIMLIVCLVFIGIALATSKNQVEWPPMVPDCPDYWTIDGSGVCVNVKNLGTCASKTMNFNTSAFTGSNEMCNKYTWATNCNVTWDGITYGVTNPCQQ